MRIRGADQAELDFRRPPRVTEPMDDATAKPARPAGPIVPRIVYHDRYNIRAPGLTQLHPFDTCKFQRAWDLIRRELGKQADGLHRLTDRAADERELLRVHTADYLASLRSSVVIAAAVEVPLVAAMPNWLVRRILIEPMLWATRGTIIAAETAMTDGAAIHLGGGYHHASRERGEGFCLFADLSIAVAALRDQGRLKNGDRVAVIDLDAHRGNGIAQIHREDPDVRIFDMFNCRTYPRDKDSIARIDCPIPLEPGTGDDGYLLQLQRKLPTFLDQHGPFALAIYNAGTDVFKEDPLGGLSLTAAGILERDLFTTAELAKRGIPWLSVTSGGYTQESAGLIATSALEVIRRAVVAATGSA